MEGGVEVGVVDGGVVGGFGVVGVFVVGVVEFDGFEVGYIGEVYGEEGVGVIYDVRVFFEFGFFVFVEL